MRQLAFFLVLTTLGPEFTATQHRPRDYRDRIRQSDIVATVESVSACPPAASCVVGPNLLNPDISTWDTYGATAAAPTVTANRAGAPDGTATAFRVQWPAVTSGESSLYVAIPGHVCAGITCEYSLYIRATPGGSGPSSGSLPLASAENNADGTYAQICSFTTSWSRCTLQFDNTHGFSYFWLGYVAAVDGAGPAMDLEIWQPKAEYGSGGASPSVCPSPNQGALPTGYYYSALQSADNGINPIRDGAGLVKLSDGTLLLMGGWNPTQPAAWGGSSVTTNEVWKSLDNGLSWIRVLAHEEEPADTVRWRKRHSFGALTATVGGVEYVYVIGGDPYDAHFGEFTGPYPADVWRSRASSRGATWERMASAAEFGSRVLMMTWAIGSDLYVAGGQTNVNDKTTALKTVYRSQNGGSAWTQLPDAPWAGRGSQSNALPVVNGEAWMMGGQAYDVGAHTYYNDVYKFDGGVWTQAVDGPWTARGYHNVLAYDGRVFVMHGTAPAMSADVWSTVDGGSGTWVQNPGSFGVADHAQSAVVNACNEVILLGGITNSTATYKLDTRYR